MNIIKFISLVALLATLDASAQSKSDRRKAGVFAPAPEMINFERVAPLLDGLYEDVAAIQMAPLQLSTVAANSSALDAVQQSLQVAFSSNSLDALQNSTNAQLFKANSAYQTSIIDQLNALSSQLSNATVAASQAQVQLASLQSQSNPAANPASITQAQSVLANANAQQAQISAQVTAVKAAQSALSLGTLTSTTPATGTSAAGTSLSSLSKFLGTQAVSPAAPSFPTASATSGSPSLPPTRQMDSQIGLLWDRVMRILSTIGEPDSAKDVQFELLRFYPSLTYTDKETTAIRIEYVVSCESSDSRKPRILDLYPRISPINILNEKFKDNSFSLAAFFGFAAANASAAYNREHLKLTNSMAQSSYATGFGSGSDTFGWILGKALGDDTIAIGQREMYALVAVPDTCNENTFVVSSNRVAWFADKGRLISDQQESTSSRASSTFSTDSTSITNVEVLQMRYSQSTGVAPAQITVSFEKELDTQARIIVNGAVIPRARDDFARGTLSVPGSSGNANNVGLFEKQDSSQGVGTWSRTARNQIAILLDAKLYGKNFPEILISSSQWEVNLLDQNIHELTVNGSGFYCSDCKDAVPSLLGSGDGSKVLNIHHWQRGATTSSGDEFIFSFQSDQDVAHTLLASVVDLPNPVPSTWGPVPVVTVIKQDFDQSKKKWVSVYDRVKSCKSYGIQLVCRGFALNKDSYYSFEVLDNQHSGGGAWGYASLSSPSNEDNIPQLLAVEAPAVSTVGGHWQFRYSALANLDVKAQLISEDPTTTRSGSAMQLSGSAGISCQSATSDLCELVIDIPFDNLSAIAERMRVLFEDARGHILGSAQLPQMHSRLLPTLTAIDLATLHLAGANLVFDKVRFGKSGAVVPLECADEQRTDCMIVGKVDVKKPTFVYLYKAATPNSGEMLYPLRLLAGQQASFWTYSPQAPPGKNSANKTGKAKNNTAVLPKVESKTRSGKT